MQIPSQIEYILQKLHAAGYEGYLVGGCVRDFLLGKRPHDFDVTTSALPEETMAVFADDRVIPTGLKHGTVTVLHGGVASEITTFRTETTYADGRHPDSVSFTRSLTEDLCRRDFTVNAMAMDMNGNIVDLYGGREDLAAGVIRAVGDPSLRFTEDALRILRAFRFAAKLDFILEPRTLSAAIRLAPRLSMVSRERIFEELDKLLCGKATGRVVQKMLLGGVFDHIFEAPALNVDALRFIDDLVPRANLRLSALFLGDAAFEKHLASLKPSNDFAKQVRRTLCCRLPENEEAPALRRTLYTYGIEPTLDRTLIERREGLFYKFVQLLEDEHCFSVRDLAITGEDVTAYTDRRGKAIGEALEDVLFAVFDEKIPNTREAELEYLSAMR